MTAKDKAPAGNYHILVVDDEMDVLDAMTEMLVGAGWKVDALTSPGAALLRIKRTRYDAMVLDIYMPEMPGLLVHSKVKFIDRELWNRTVFVSGHFSTEDLRRSLEGSARFVAKPFTSEALVGTVGMALPSAPRAVSEVTASGRPDGKPDRS